MVASSVLLKTCYHERSISMPSRPHPLSLRVEEGLNKLKTWVSLSMSTTSTFTAEVLHIRLGGLKDLYCDVEDLLQLPLTQQALVHHQQEKWVDQVLDGCVRLLDICGSTRDTLLTMKEQVQDLQSALRTRRGGKSSIEKSIRAYICSRKKVKKDISKRLRELKRKDNKSTSSALLEDIHLSMVVRVLTEVRALTISIFESILSFMSMPVPTTKPCRRSWVSKVIHKGVIRCEGSEEAQSEVKSVDVALYELCRLISCKDVKVGSVEKEAQKRLEALEVSVGYLDGGLESIFRCLIQTRVSLLNIINH